MYYLQLLLYSLSSHISTAGDDMVSVEKPGTPAEVLEHHGVKGQKWGVRRKFNRANPTSHDKAKAIRVARAKSNVKFS